MVIPERLIERQTHLTTNSISDEFYPSLVGSVYAVYVETIHLVVLNRIVSLVNGTDA